MINALPEAEIFNSVVLPDEEEAPALVDWMIADLEAADPYTNLPVGLSMPFLKQLQRHKMFILVDVEMVRPKMKEFVEVIEHVRGRLEALGPQLHGFF